MQSPSPTPTRSAPARATPNTRLEEKKFARVMWDDDGDMKNKEIPLVKGEILEVLDMTDAQGWWYGLNLETQTFGFFPHNLVALLSDAEVEALRAEDTAQRDQDELADLCVKFRACTEVKDRTYMFKTYPKCFVGKDAVESLIKARLATNEATAVALGNRLFQAGLFSHVLKQHTFKNDILYYRFASDESALVPIGIDFWNIRGSFVLQKLIPIQDVQTHMSLIRLPSNKFIVLDAIKLTPELKQEIDTLTDRGKDIEAVLFCHPFHTTHIGAFVESYPKCKFFGCPRHLSKLTNVSWAGNLHDPEVRRKFEPHLFLRIPDGIEFVNPQPPASNHFASVVVFHPKSATLHVDDTLMMWTAPNLVLRLAGIRPGLAFHPSLMDTLEDPAKFKAWVNALLKDWNFANICCAHMGNQIGAGHQSLSKLLSDSEKTFELVAAKRAELKKMSISQRQIVLEMTDRCVEGEECG